MTTNLSNDDLDPQGSEGATTVSRAQGGDAKPDSTNGTGAEPDDDHEDDPVTGVGPEDPS